MSRSRCHGPAPMHEREASAGIPELDEVTDRDQPMVLRGLVQDWPVVRLARQSDSAFAKYLAARDSGTPVDVLVVPPEAEGMVGYCSDLSGFNFTHHKVALTQGLRRLAQCSHQRDGTGLAIQSAPISECLPGFALEHETPLLDPSVQPRIWIGNQVVTPTHFDSMHNLACVVCGARRFTLFPPDQIANLYIGPPDFAPTGAAISMARIEPPDFARFPRLREAMDHALVAELEPGDAIYIPPLWWHNVASLNQLNALVNYWWLPLQVPGFVAGHEMSALYHCILAYRSLPPAQRQAWQGLLNHYVFSDNDPIPHVPATRRGVLATPPDAEQVNKLKSLARRHLDDEP